MKRVVYCLSLIVLLSVIIACEPVKEDMSSAALHAVSSLYGKYELTAVEFSEPVDVSGDGYASTDILRQMKDSGWGGIQSIDYVSPLVQNIVLPTLKVNSEAQINLYLPVTLSLESERELARENGTCNVEMATYQFHYTVDNEGSISFDYPKEFKSRDYTIPYQNVDIAFVPDEQIIVLKSVTHFNDMSRGGWRGGYVQLTYQRIDKQVLL